MLLGLGLGRYITNGLELGLYYQAWVGAEPFVSKLTPQVTYVMTRAPMITPYLGVFYTRTWVEGDYDDLDSYGGRAGIFKGRGRTNAGVGVVFEKYASFDEKGYDGDSWTIYPEVFVSASF